jgi:hypothetical protein
MRRDSGCHCDLLSAVATFDARRERDRIGLGSSRIGD